MELMSAKDSYEKSKRNKSENMEYMLIKEIQDAVEKGEFSIYANLDQTLKAILEKEGYKVERQNTLGADVYIVSWDKAES